jgi:hypothetical protein
VKEKFIDWKPSKKSLELLEHVEEIVEDYQGQGYTLTLRQLYYQLVSRGLIPNTVKQYNSIGNLASKARLAGIVDWSAIEDRGRSRSANGHWEHPSEIVRTAIDSYYKDRWKNQSERIEVWVEKDAVSGIIQPVCSEWDVPFMANKGYSSQTALYDAAQRFLYTYGLRNGMPVTVIYLGDHDPSGIDMVRDIEDRLRLFLGEGGEGFNVERVALNMDQVNLYNPPENPAKTTDSRFDSYAKVYGTSSWELDALDPKVLSQVVEDAIFEHLDMDEFERVAEEESEEKDKLRELCKGLEEGF